MVVRVIVVQHAEKERTAGDPALTPRGHEQAIAVADWVGATHPDALGVWSSPLARTRQTADPIAAALGLPVHIDDRLVERMNWSDDRSQTLDEFLADWRHASADRDHQPLQGESSLQAGARFVDALRAIAEQVVDGVAVVVSHGGVTVDALRTLVGDAAVDAAGPTLVTDGVPNGAVTILSVELGQVDVVSYPDTHHLER
ncbi:MAG: histidine phosphatase family protein [Actinomycetota bacterium]